MIKWKQMRHLAVIVLAASAGACVAPDAKMTAISTPKSGAEIACLPTTNHPVCKATFGSISSATLRAGEISTGTVSIDGKPVTYTCYAGNADRQQPRQCSW